MKRIDYYEGTPIKTVSKDGLTCIVLPALEPADSELLTSCFNVTKDIGEELLNRGIRNPSDEDVLDAAKVIIEKDHVSSQAIDAMFFMKRLTDLMKEQTPIGNKAVEVFIEIGKRFKKN